MTQGNDRIDTLSHMFEASRALIGGAKIIIDSDGIKDGYDVLIPTLPVTVCLSLAIEIQIKALLEASGTPRPKKNGHDLVLLFNALSNAVQNDFLSFQSSVTGLSADAALNLIQSERNTFKMWRYPYEKAHLETQPAPLYHLALAFNQYLMSNFNIERSENGWIRK